MAECKDCRDRGVMIGNGETVFCNCKNGKMRELQHKSNMLAQEAAKKEAGKRAVEEAQKAEQLELEVKTEPGFQPGDWVKYESSIHVGGHTYFYGWIVGSGKRHCRVLPVAVSKDGEMTHGLAGVVNVNKERLEPWELEPIPNHAAIDIALDTNDREWFEQLTKGVEWK
ncbi:hypothetical protein PPK15_gp66 [Bacillus phage 000TH010]|uniref:IDEAL domain-containing protein n=1 Tax=Bacillus phage 000TH010 TaxID=2601652 RepID=A0A5P8PHY3_9CAUD|nr:hypothetical protein PPK15_gp66 [Bacillus phage 000TH010]QFR56279.1 hypothetical protein 000TH010_66 [Bacillus phage 000TH010]